MYNTKCCKKYNLLNFDWHNNSFSDNASQINCGKAIMNSTTSPRICCRTTFGNWNVWQQLTTWRLVWADPWLQRRTWPSDLHELLCPSASASASAPQLSLQRQTAKRSYSITQRPAVAANSAARCWSCSPACFHDTPCCWWASNLHRAENAQTTNCLDVDHLGDTRSEMELHEY